ncbi:hypothetical protein BTS2_0254 [Bacillus sp. TS-2]|nr:hypothetical protein BTS2_0254 [Bacillus sp. TS-2]
MSKEEYLKKLQIKIKKLPKEDINEVMDFYNEYFLEAGDENSEAVISRLGSPSFVASQILADYAVKELDHPTVSTKKSFSAMWLIILAILAAPIALPMLIVMVTLAFCLILVYGLFILTLAIVVFCLPISGIYSVISGFAVIFQQWQTSIFFVGVGLVAIGLGVLLFDPFIRFTKAANSRLVKLLKRLFDKMIPKSKEEK